MGITTEIKKKKESEKGHQQKFKKTGKSFAKHVYDRKFDNGC